MTDTYKRRPKNLRGRRWDDNKRYLKETGCDNVKYAGDSPQQPSCDLQLLIRRLPDIFMNKKSFNRNQCPAVRRIFFVSSVNSQTFYPGFVCLRYVIANLLCDWVTMLSVTVFSSSSSFSFETTPTTDALIYQDAVN